MFKKKAKTYCEKKKTKTLLEVWLNLFLELEPALPILGMWLGLLGLSCPYEKNHFVF